MGACKSVSMDEKEFQRLASDYINIFGVRDQVLPFVLVNKSRGQKKYDKIN